MLNNNHIGLLIGILILISMMIICHYANKQFTIGNLFSTDKFQNISHARSSSNLGNGINYYATPDCKNQTLACPGQHPMIPCSLIKKCPGKVNYDNLNDEDKKIVDMYIYLTSLLKSVDIYKFPNDDYWYR